MALRVVIDQIGNQNRPQEPFTIASRTALTIVGWAADTDSGAMPPITLQVDDSIEVSSTRQMRPGVGRFLNDDALSNAGFVIVLDAHLLPGKHTISLGTTVDGAFSVARTVELTVVAALDRPPAWPRLLVASSPKSGSSYTRNILGYYFDLVAPPVAGVFQAWETNLDGWLTSRLRDRAFVFDIHLRPYAQNLAVIESLDFVPVVTWRNLADTVISLDDHLRREAGEHSLLMDLEDKTEYGRLSDQDRYQLLSRWITPWYVNFYVGWRRQQPPIFMHYEWLAVDPFAYFSHIIGNIAGSVDATRLNDILRRGASYSEDFFNVGINGRANQNMSDATKAHLEACLSGPFHHNIDELLRELPWNEGPAAVLPNNKLLTSSHRQH